MNAIAYARISLKDQSDYSLEYQERLARQYCEANKLTFLAAFKDDGESSYTFDRPDWQALEAFIKVNKNVQYLIVSDHDRFSRNLAEALLKIKELQDKYKIKVLATTDPFDTDFTDPATFMIRAFKYMMAESELHNIRKRTKNGMIQAAMNGRHANMAPYGYKNSRDNNNRPILIIDDAKATIVRLIFKFYLHGADLEQVRSMVREYGYNQKSNSAIRRILSNPVYCGLIPIPAHKGRRKQFAAGLHVALIPEPDFWQVQERLSGKGIATQKRAEVPLRGSLKCWCGRKVTAGNSRNKIGKYYWYYLCPEHRENLPARKLHEQFDELLDHLSISRAQMAWLQKEMAGEVGARIQTQGEEVRKLAWELKSIQTQIEATERKYLTKGNISESTFDKVMSELRSEQSRMQKEITAHSADQDIYLDRINALLPKLCNLREAYHEMELETKQQFVSQVFDNSLYYRDQVYRTPAVIPFLAGNELILNEKRLLIIEKPLPKMGDTPIRTRDGSRMEHNGLEALGKLLELIA